MPRVADWIPLLRDKTGTTWKLPSNWATGATMDDLRLDMVRHVSVYAPNMMQDLIKALDSPTQLKQENFWKAVQGYATTVGDVNGVKGVPDTNYVAPSDEYLAYAKALHKKLTKAPATSPTAAPAPPAVSAPASPAKATPAPIVTAPVAPIVPEEEAPVLEAPPEEPVKMVVKPELELEEPAEKIENPYLAPPPASPPPSRDNSFITCVSDAILTDSINDFFGKVEKLVKEWEGSFDEKDRVIDPNTISANDMFIAPLGSTKALLPYVVDLGSGYLCLPLPDGWGVYIKKLPITVSQFANLLVSKNASLASGSLPTVDIPPVLKVIKNMYKTSTGSDVEFGMPGAYNCIEDDGTMRFVNAILRRV